MDNGLRFKEELREPLANVGFAKQTNDYTYVVKPFHEDLRAAHRWFRSPNPERFISYAST